MLTIQLVSLVAAGLIAYYIGRKGSRWRVALSLVLGLIAGWIVGMIAAVMWADGNTDVMDRGLGAAFWFTIVGAIVGAWAGRYKAPQQPTANVGTASSAATESTESQASTSDAKHLKVARQEAWLGKYKPEILVHSKKIAGDDPSRIDAEYIKLRAEELERQLTNKPEAPDNPSSPRSDEALITHRPVKKPPDWVVYIVFAAVVIPFAAIYGSEHIKAFIAGFTAPANKEDCVNKYVYPAGTETAARALMISCTRQFDSNKSLSEWDYCLRDGDLSSITTETAARARVRTCNQL